MIQSYQINVYGIVQGVGFRWFTKRLADKYRIVGWVHNKLDNSVEIKAQGDEADMSSFLSELTQGPGFYSRVDKEVKQAVGPFESNNFAIK